MHSGQEAPNTVLVVGGAGYVGSHTCKALHQAGYAPVVFDNLSRGHAGAVKWGPLIIGDILDLPTLQAVMVEVRPLAVLHFAAFAYVGESMAQPAQYFRNNVVGTLNLLDALRGMPAEQRRLVFSSSCAVYGGIHHHPIDETTPLQPASTYGNTKRICEDAIADYARSHGVSAIALRYFNAAAADPDGELIEDHAPEPHIIPTVLRVAAGLEPQVVINGTDHPTPDGTCVRDFVHVSDLARAHVAAVKRLEQAERPAFEAFNLSAGLGASLNGIVESARRVTGRPIPVTYGPKRAGDPPYAVGRGDRAAAALHWTPRFTDLDQLVADAWARYQNTHPLFGGYTADVTADRPAFSASHVAR